jgi:membrane protease YdiL (CAAX protease family)
MQMTTLSDTPHTGLPFRAVIPFALMTFAITWAIIGGYVLFPETAASAFGDISGSHPLYFVATWAPGISALVLVLSYTGVSGLGAFLSRVLIWRAPPVWWLFILAGIPLVFMAGSLAKGGPLLAPLPPEGIAPVLSLMLMMLFLGPVEEFGWRGVAQPLLQRHMAPIWAGMLIGATWGLWHLPAFFLAGVVFADWNFLPFFVGNVTLAVLVTPILNAARGSLLLPMAFHWQLINPVWPDAQPWDTWILVAVAAVIVWWKRNEMFSREGAVTEVIPGEGRT